MEPAAELELRLAELLRGEQYAEAATIIVRDYGPGLLGYIGTLVRDDDSAREVFAEFAAQMWKSLPRFARRSSVKTWAYAIAYRCVLRFRRAIARRRTRPLGDSEYSKIAQSVASLARSFSRSAADRKLEALRRTLSDEEHTLLVLRLDRAMSWQDIGNVVGARTPVALAALRKRFQRLKDRLREQAKREGMIRAS